MALLFRNHPIDVADIDGRLADLARQLRVHRAADPALETMLWERVDALLDERLRLGDADAIARAHQPVGS